MKKLLLFSIISLFTTSIEINAQRKKSKKKKIEQTAIVPKKSKIPKYSDFVTSKTKTDEGLFKVHENKEKFIYEIPKSYLGKEMLLVTRIKELPAIKLAVNAGSKINTQVIVFDKVANNSGCSWATFLAHAWLLSKSF